MTKSSCNVSKPAFRKRYPGKNVLLRHRTGYRSSLSWMVSPLWSQNLVGDVLETGFLVKQRATGVMYPWSSRRDWIFFRLERLPLRRGEVEVDLVQRNHYPVLMWPRPFSVAQQRRLRPRAGSSERRVSPRIFARWSSLPPSHYLRVFTYVMIYCWDASFKYIRILFVAKPSKSSCRSEFGA